MCRGTFLLLEYVKNVHKKNKRANRMLMILVILFLVSFIALITVASARVETGLIELQRENGSLATAVLHDATEVQKKKIQVLPYVDSFCEQKTFGYFYYSGNKISTCAVMDESGFNKMFAPAYEYTVGAYPRTENEIMLSRNTLQLIGIDNPCLGMRIDTDLILKSQPNAIGKTMTGSFHLSGYYNEFYDNENHLPAAYFSANLLDNEYVKEYDNDIYFLSSLIWVNAGHLESRIYEDLGYEDGQQLSVLNLGTIQILRDMLGSLIFVAFVIIIITITIYSSILNIVNLHTYKECRQYQLLKVLGVTERQFRTIIFLNYFSPIGKGLLIGFLCSYLIAHIICFFVSSVFLIPVNMLSVWWIAGGTLIIGAESLAAVFVGSNKVDKVSSRKHLPAKHRGMGKIETLINNIILLKIAWKHTKVNVRQLLITIFSIFLGIEVYMISIIVCQGIDPIYKLNGGKDFRIGITKQAVENYFYEKDGLVTENVIQVPFISNDFINSIVMTAQTKTSDLEFCYGYLGIADYETGFIFSNSYHSMDDPFTGVTIQAVSSQWIEMLEKYCIKNKLNVDIDSFIKGDTFILLHNGAGIHYEEEIKNLGNCRLKLSFFGQNKEADFPCSGIFDIADKGFPELYMPWDGDVSDYIIVSQRVVDDLELSPQVYEIAFDVPEKDENIIKKQLIQLIAGYNEGKQNVSSFYIISKSEELKKAKLFIQSTRLIMCIFSFVLLFMAMVNYLLTIYMRMENEKDDIILLEKVGLSQREIRKYISFETLIYSFFTCIIIFTLGLAAIKFIKDAMEKSVDYFNYSFPFGRLLLILIFVFGIGFAATINEYKSFLKTISKK